MKNLITNYKNTKKLLDVEFISRTKSNKFDKIFYQNKELYNFSSNDYLSLSKNPVLIKTSQKWTDEYGTSLSSSRLVSGNLEKIKEIEKNLSRFSLNEKSLVMGSGFQANSTLIPALTGNSLGSRCKTFIFSDKLNHSSINHGCLLTKQRIFRYRHLDLNHLEYLLKKVPKSSQKLIVSETIFSMDGDFVDIDSIRFLSEKYDSILYFDEAHSMGVYGNKGFGLASTKKKVEKEIILGTFSKGFGSYGSFVSCSNYFKKKIINSCGGLIYSTVLPPAVLGSIYAAVKIMPKLDTLRKKIKENSIFLISELKKNKINVGGSNSHIIPMILNDIESCEKLKKFLIKEGFFIKLIKSPTVPEGSERIRISLTATIEKKIISRLIKTIKNFQKNED